MRAFFKNSKQPRPQGEASKPIFSKPRIEIPKSKILNQVQDLVRDDSKTRTKPICHAELVSALNLFFSPLARHTFRLRPQDGVFKCALNKGRLATVFEFFFVLMILTSGCSFGSKTTYSVNQYTLEYPSPVLKEIVPIKEPIKIERFSAANAFDTSAIVYRDGPNLRNIDPYNRWRAKPGDMVTDFLIRDLRHSGLFHAVFSYNQTEETRYLLEGQVNEFLESKDKDGLKAVLSLNITFFDQSKKETTEKVVFQREYRYTEPLEKETYEGLAQAMSKATENFSKQMMMDLHQATIAGQTGMPMK